MKHASLLHHCVKILDSFNKKVHGVEQHLASYIHQNKTLDPGEQAFITEVFSGSVQHAKVMNIVVEGFFRSHGWNSLKSDKNLYTVLCYLSLYRLDELGMANYRKFIRTQDVNKMFRFLAFFLNEDNLLSWIKDEWCKIYEHTYVQVNLMSPILRWLPELKELISQLQDKINNKVKSTKSLKAVTEPVAFKLTKPRPRSVPVPERIATVAKPKEVPKSTYKVPSEHKLIQEAKERNRRRTEEQLLESTKSQFKCATKEKSEKTKLRIQNVIADQESKLRFEGSRARPLPSNNTDNIPIKLNMATILREGALYQRREEDAIKKLNLLEAGAKDASEFLTWQEEMRQKDLDKELAVIERRRLEGKLSHEEAILARQSLIQDNRQKVLKMKEEAEKMMQEYVARRLEEEKVLRELVEDVMAGHQNAKQTKQKLQNYKRKIAEEVSEESRELLRQAFEEAAIEMQRKLDLVQEIRAMEAAPKNTKKFIDWTSTAGHALLSEMSIAELKERLSLMKAKQIEEEENKRDFILEAKEAKEHMLMEKLEQISRHRFAEGQMASKKQSVKQKKNDNAKIMDPKLKALQERLEQKRIERLEVTEKNKIQPTKESAALTSNLNKQKVCYSIV
ncbi:cilia- and flagella-associated protein 99-like [Anneissia japonica]|uniref:cilia- and flagella-associated protein 99-like n=1 Tax=Anneissia japonica TaxID=1529436 RepID=UPI001425A0BA|nr:cilia- and flagella-associated protein 99-like [Anneissia japonica]